MITLSTNGASPNPEWYNDMMRLWQEQLVNDSYISSIRNIMYSDGYYSYTIDPVNNVATRTFRVASNPAIWNEPLRYSGLQAMLEESGKKKTYHIGSTKVKGEFHIFDNTGKSITSSNDRSRLEHLLKRLNRGEKINGK